MIIPAVARRNSNLRNSLGWGSDCLRLCVLAVRQYGNFYENTNMVTLDSRSYLGQSFTITQEEQARLLRPILICQASLYLPGPVGPMRIKGLFTLKISLSSLTNAPRPIKYHHR
jgi:hypothetical protein